MDKKINTVTIILVLLSLVLVCWLVFGGPFDTFYLIWNLILAWAPMVFALIFRKNLRGKLSSTKSIITFFSSFLWLFFFPNAVYIITDYIHLSNEKFYYPNPNYTPYSGESRVLYNFDLQTWNNFFSITFGVFLGCALSVLSLYIFHKYIEKHKGKLVGWIFAITVHLLSGYAIYLGRFIRFNSWDVIFNPLNIVKFVISNINKIAATFTFYFSLLSLLIYGVFYLFIYLGEDKITN